MPEVESYDKLARRLFQRLLKERLCPVDMRVVKYDNRITIVDVRLGWSFSSHLSFYFADGKLEELMKGTRTINTAHMSQVRWMVAYVKREFECSRG